MSQFPSPMAKEMAGIVMRLFKGMTIYDIKGVIEIITLNVDRVSNGTIYEPFGVELEIQEKYNKE